MRTRRGVRSRPQTAQRCFLAHPTEAYVLATRLIIAISNRMKDGSSGICVPGHTAEVPVPLLCWWVSDRTGRFLDDLSRPATEKRHRYFPAPDTTAKVVGAALFVEPELEIPLVFLPGFSHNIRFRRMNLFSSHVGG